MRDDLVLESGSRTVDRGVSRHHFPRRRAPPDVVGAALFEAAVAGSVVDVMAMGVVPTSCLCSQSR
jgi:thiamine monophosphate kinase